MKNRVLSLILIAVMLLLVAVFSACGGGGNDPEPCTKDEDKNLICDVCQSEIPPCEHVDVNKDLVCDICREKLEPEKISVTLTIKGEDEVGVANATIILTNEDESKITLTTNEQGVAAYDLVAGNYRVEFENLPQYWYSESNYSTITVSQQRASFSFVAIDNSPNGTSEKPFPVEDAETGEPATITFPANQSYIFTTKSVVRRYLVINDEDVVVIYKGTEYTAEAGAVKVLFEATNSNNVTYITVKNNSSEEKTISLTFEAVPGTAENPIEVTYGFIHSSTLVKGQSVYYKAIATQAGYIAVHSPSEFNNVSISNISSYDISEATRGGKATYIYAEAGDEISICVEVMNDAEDDTPYEISIMVEERQGTELNRIVLYETEVFVLKAGETLYFATGENATIEFAFNGSVLVNGEEITILEDANAFYVTNQGTDSVEIGFGITYSQAE